MQPGMLIVVEVFRKDAVQMPFAEHDQVIHTFSAHGADDAFAVWILPRRAWCDRDFFDPHVFHAVLEIVAVDAVAIANEKTLPVVTEHDEDVQDTKGHGPKP